METYSTAVSDFRRARERAALQRLIGRLTGKSTELLSYEEVRQNLRTSGVIARELREIPIDSIVGSVGRYQDFTRSFLPIRDSDQDRWARVMVATNDLTGLPPVDLYQIGDVYFVYDGHHRVSVARRLGATVIQAYVTEIKSKVPLGVDTSPDDLIIAVEHSRFLEITNLDRLRPEANLAATCPGQYEQLLEHIEVHRHYMGIEGQREIPYEEAVAHWYDHVYLPVVELIREYGLLRYFPERTETDLYLWIGRHRADIEDEFGWEVPYQSAAIDLADSEGAGAPSLATRIARRAIEIVIPVKSDDFDEEEASPLIVQELPEDRLFVDILVAISGEEDSWQALEQAIIIAKKEEGRIRGLFVVSEEQEREGEIAQEIRDRFYWRCGEVGVRGDFAVAVGSIAKTVCQRSRFSDLVVIFLSHPPEGGPLSRMSSGIRTMLRRCPGPVLAVIGQQTPLSKIMLAYDGRSKSDQALYLVAYLAGRWETQVTVAAVKGSSVDRGILDKAKAYFDKHQLTADYVLLDGPVAETLTKKAEEDGMELVIVGGYSGLAVIEAVIGSDVDDILTNSTVPVLVAN